MQNGGTGFFLLGSMLGRILGPIVNDYIEFETPWGRSIAQKKYERDQRVRQAEFDSKVKLTEIDYQNRLKLAGLDHKRKLEVLQIQYEQNCKRAKEQMRLSFSEWQQKLFWDKCFPLRNPFEMPLGVNFRPDEKTGGNNDFPYIIQTVTLPDNRRIVPLRVITAFKDSTSPHASTISGNLSLFLVQNFSANGEHAVVSDIGAWKEEMPINDASVNYLFMGQRGLPTLILVPTYTNGGSIIRMKLWSWGFGEELAYPKGFDFGWFNIEMIRQQVLLDEIKSFDKTLRKLNVRRPTQYNDFETGLAIVKLIDNIEGETDIEREHLLSLLERIPAQLSSIVQRKTNDVISTIFSCATAMYIDGYHLSNYGTLPLLPRILPQMPGVKMILSQVQQYYLGLLKVALLKGIIGLEEVLTVELDMYETFTQIGVNSDELSSLSEQIKVHGFDLSHSQICDQATIERLKQRKNYLIP